MLEAASGVRALLLAAGSGSRLRPLSDGWPKSLMPIGGRPLLDIWLSDLWFSGVREVRVNVHHHQTEMLRFLDRPRYRDWVRPVVEEELLGTAGSVRANQEFLSAGTALLVHADNFCVCDLEAFFRFHLDNRPQPSVMTMMTFNTSSPESCGIVEVDEHGLVLEFHEKVNNPPGFRANGAVYLLEEEVIERILARPQVTDFSTGVVPEFLGRIATWHNKNVHHDIGTPAMLCSVQEEHRGNRLGELWEPDEWTTWFAQHPIHVKIEGMYGRRGPS